MTSSKNRDSIERHGLDWMRMGATCGIAGSSAPEQEGIFLCADEEEADWFVSLNAPGGGVDVWAVDGVDEAELVESPEHHFFAARRIPRSQLTLLHADLRGTLLAWSDWTYDESGNGSRHRLDT